MTPQCNWWNGHGFARKAIFQPGSMTLIESLE
jgi:hypothetical protein